MRLYGYWRSSATHRVRIALNWKGLGFGAVPTNLVQGEHRRLTYLEKNPQGLVPALEADGAVLGQSLAILEYLEETRPEPPLLPKEPLARARVRSLAQLVAGEIHPLNNLRVLNHIRPSNYPQAAPAMAAPSLMSMRRDHPRHITVLPGGGSEARAR